jgi:hypothetical protein
MTETRDELLLELGLVPNSYLLEINHHLTVPRDMLLPPPWNLASRLFRFPIEIGDATEDGIRSIGLMHPLLKDHPFVRRVEAVLGIELNPNGAPNAQGVSGQRTGRWLRIPDHRGHGFRGKVGTISRRRWAWIPRQGGRPV